MSNNGYSGPLKKFWRKRRDNSRFCTLVEQGVTINLKYCQVLYGFNFFFLGLSQVLMSVSWLMLVVWHSS